MTREERSAYSRGYQAASHRRWPAHQPPEPPNEIIAELMRAMTTLRNGLDGELAQLFGEKSWESKWGPKIDAADAAMAKVSRWLLEATCPS